MTEKEAAAVEIRKQTLSLEFGIDAGLADLGIDQEKKAEMLDLMGLDNDGFTELAIQCLQERQTQ